MHADLHDAVFVLGARDHSRPGFVLSLHIPKEERCNDKKKSLLAGQPFAMSMFGNVAATC